MTIVVEDGSIVSGANSYVSTTDLTTYATARGITLEAGAETLLIQAMDYIEGLSYKGTKRTRDQALQWPRVDVYLDGYYFESDEIPQQLKDGLCQTAIAIDQGYGPLVDVPRTTVMEKVGEIEVQYAPGGPTKQINVKIKTALWKLLESGGGQITVGKG